MKAELVAELRAAFRLEALECVAVLRGGVQVASDILVLRRAAHTLKGGAAICGYGELRDIAQSLEDRLDLTAERGALNADDTSSLSRAIKEIEALIESIVSSTDGNRPDRQGET